MLTEFYKELLSKCDPLEAQMARDDGRLLEFAQYIMGDKFLIEEEVRNILGNL